MHSAVGLYQAINLSLSLSCARCCLFVNQFNPRKGYDIEDKRARIFEEIAANADEQVSSNSSGFKNTYMLSEQTIFLHSSGILALIIGGEQQKTSERKWARVCHACNLGRVKLHCCKKVNETKVWADKYYNAQTPDESNQQVKRVRARRWH